MQKPIVAALLALSSAVAFAANANAEAQSKGTYFIRTGDAAVLSAPVVRTESAVIAPVQTTVVAPATTVVAEPMMTTQTLVMPAVIMMPAGFSMDPAAMQLYRGPRLENTLTMPDANTWLRP